MKGESKVLQVDRFNALAMFITSALVIIALSIGIAVILSELREMKAETRDGVQCLVVSDAEHRFNTRLSHDRILEQLDQSPSSERINGLTQEEIERFQDEFGDACDKFLKDDE